MKNHTFLNSCFKMLVFCRVSKIKKKLNIPKTRIFNYYTVSKFVIQIFRTVHFFSAVEVRKI